MAAVVYAFDKPLMPLGMLLDKGVGKTQAEVSRLIWKEVYAVPTKSFSISDASSRYSSQAELVDSLVSKAVRLFEEDGHMYSLGYRRAGRGNFETKLLGGAIESRFPNWVVAYLKSSPWQLLLNEIGDVAMVKILWDLPMLAIKRESRFIQISGRPFPSVLTEIGRDLESGIDGSARQLALRSIGRPFSRYKNTSHWGLPQTHPLNVLQDPRRPVSREQARKLSVIIAQGSAEGEGSRKRMSPPWRRAIPKLQRLIENHRRCPYSSLFDRAKRKHRPERTDDNTENLILSLRRYDTPYEVVSAFLKLALLRIVPRPFWGSKATKRLLLSRIERYVVRGNVSEPVVWDQVMESIEAVSFPWLFGDHLTRRRASHDEEKVVRKWIEFLFTNLAMAILSSFFFLVRDDSGRTVYYTKRVWKRNVIGDLSLELDQFRIMSRTELIVANQHMSKRRFGGPKLRFLHKRKANDFRLIMNLSYKDSRFAFSPNAALRPAFHALKFEVERNPSLGGSFVQGVDAVFEKYKSFIQRTRGEKKTLPPLFAVALDIRRCFDTMHHDKILQCAADALKQDEYSILTHSHSFLDYGMRRVRTKRVKTVRPVDSDDFWSIPAFEDDSILHKKRLGCVSTDGMVRQFVAKERVLSLIRELLLHTYVSFGNNWYHLTEGVPQGSIISTLLCRLYYGAFEKYHLSHLVHPEEDLLMRMVDDFLLITPCEERAMRFVEYMSVGNAEWGCYVNKAKTRVASSKSSHWIPWCGLLIDVKNGWVRINYDGKDVFSGSKAFLRGIGKTMRAAFAVKCRPLVLDLEINSVLNVFINIAQIFLVCATRYISYLKFVKFDDENIQPCLQTLDEIDDLFRFAFSLIQNRVRCDENFCSLVVVNALGWTAFTTKFKSEYLNVPEEFQKRAMACWKRRPRFVAGVYIDWRKVDRCVAHVSGIL